MTAHRKLFVALYTASGAAALVYEVTWTRLLTLHMGHTVAAASTVLAAFMGGLAVGSWLAGRPALLSRRRTLRAYAALELVVAAAALALPVMLRAVTPALAWAYADGDAPVRFELARVAICLALVGVPAVAMGATFPIAASSYAREATDAGLLYAMNTAGAALGAIAAGFWLIPAIGISGTTQVGVALNLSAAAGATWLAALREHQDDEVRRGRRGEMAAKAAAPRLATIAVAVSGFVALVYEVAWTRLLALVVGPTTYAFTIVVAAFIIGIAIGSAAASRLIRRSPQPVMWLATMLTMTAVTASIAAWFAASRLPLIVAGQVADPDAAFGPVVLRQAAGIALLLLPTTVSLGAVFPIALAIASADPIAIARDAARVYASNTLGAIAGALAAGFALLPYLGLDRAFRTVALVGLIAAAVVLAASNRSRHARRRAATAAAAIASCAAIVVALPRWDLNVLGSGAYKYAPYIAVDDLATELKAWQLLYYKDGPAATVSVRHLAGMRSLVIDGKVDASNMGDMLTQRLLGLLPVLMHRKPEEVCIIGLGSGVTLAAALAPGTVRHADVIEISPEVVKASEFFEHENGGALSAPGVRLIVGDGRSHLLLTRRRYDVIVSEPSNPWMSGIAALFTREFFEAARARLEPDGVICQWAHTYDISDSDLRSIVRTFASVFPQATMWLAGDGDLLLIGTNGDSIDRHLDTIAAQLERKAAAAQLQDLGVPHDAAAFALFSLVVAGPAELQAYGGAADVQRDDRMALEFSAPRAIYGVERVDNAGPIRALAAPGANRPAARAAIARADAARWTAAGRMELKADGYIAAYDRFQRAIRLDGRNVDALSGLVAAAAGAHRQGEAVEWLRKVASAEPDNPDVRVELSRLLAAMDRQDEAATMAADAMRIAPADPRPAEQLASVFADAGDVQRLEPLANVLVARFPDREAPRYFHATALFLKGQAHEAIEPARQVVAANPQNVRAQNLLGVACATVGRRDCALAAFDAAIAASPRDATTYLNLGVLRLQSGDPAGAAQDFSVALTLDRSSAAARQGLAEAKSAAQQKRGAAPF